MVVSLESPLVLPTEAERVSVRGRRYHMSANDLLNSVVKHQRNQTSDRVKIIS